MFCLEIIFKQTNERHAGRKTEHIEQIQRAHQAAVLRKRSLAEVLQLENGREVRRAEQEAAAGVEKGDRVSAHQLPASPPGCQLRFGKSWFRILFSV